MFPKRVVVTTDNTVSSSVDAEPNQEGGSPDQSGSPWEFASRTWEAHFVRRRALIWPRIRAHKGYILSPARFGSETCHIQTGKSQEQRTGVKIFVAQFTQSGLTVYSLDKVFFSLAEAQEINVSIVVAVDQDELVLEGLQ